MVESSYIQVNSLPLSELTITGAAVEIAVWKKEFWVISATRLKRRNGKGERTHHVKRGNERREEDGEEDHPESPVPSSSSSKAVGRLDAGPSLLSRHASVLLLINVLVVRGPSHSLCAEPLAVLVVRVGGGRPVGEGRLRALAAERVRDAIRMM